MRLDTVGAVVLVGEAREVGQRPEVAAGVSRCVVPSIFPFLSAHATYFLPFSGGILLKHSGRVGEVSQRARLSVSYSERYAS